MERIFKAIDNNPEALFFKIVDSKGAAVGSGNGDDSEDLKAALETELDYLEDGKYKILLGKAHNISERNNSQIVAYSKGNQNTKQTMSRVGYFTAEDLALAEEKGFQQGKKEATLLNLLDRMQRAESDIQTIKNKINRVIETLDEADGEKDGLLGGNPVELMTTAKTLMDSFK